MVFTSSRAVAAVASLVLLASPVSRPAVRIGVTFSVAEGSAFKVQGVGFAAIADEANHIWRPHGVSVGAVSLLDPVAPGLIDVWIAVELLPRLDRAAAGSASLGAIVFRDEGFEPGLRIAVDSVDEILRSAKLNGRPIAAWPPRVTNAVRWRALGRVLAHELGHYLVGLPVHRSGGLMRTGFDSQALASPDRGAFRLDEIDVPQLHARLGRLSNRSALARVARTPD